MGKVIEKEGVEIDLVDSKFGYLTSVLGAPVNLAKDLGFICLRGTVIIKQSLRNSASFLDGCN
jgi:hypothetical protein